MNGAAVRLVVLRWLQQTAGGFGLIANDWLSMQYDYIRFIYGLAFIILTVICIALHGQKGKALPWLWLGCFALIRGSNEWLGMFSFMLKGSQLELIRLFLIASSNLFLVEFARSGWLQLKGHTLGYWIYAPLLLLVGLGAGAGIAGLAAMSRYSFGLVGGVWSVVLLYQLAQTSKLTTAAKWVRLAALSLAGYIILTGLVAGKATLFPASIINNELISRNLGIPIQLLRACFAALLTGVIWKYFMIQRLGRESEDGEYLPALSHSYRIIGLTLTLGLIMVITMGWLVADQIGVNEDREFRSETRLLAETMSQLIDPQLIKQLSGSKADLGRPEYQNLLQRLAKINQEQKELAAVNLFGRRGDQVFFYINTYPADGLSIRYSRAIKPGEVYHEASPALLRIFRSGQAATKGPLEDQWGEWFSGLAAITDPQSQRVLAVLGIDIAASTWQRRIAKSRLAPILVVLVVSLLLITFLELLRRAEQGRVELERNNRKLTLANVNLEEKYAQSYTIKLIQEEIGGELDTDQLFQKTADIVLGVLGSTRCLIYILNEENRVLALKARAGFEIVAIEENLALMNSGLVARSWRDAKTYSENDLSVRDYKDLKKHNLGRLLTIPLKSRERCFGVIEVAYGLDQTIGQDLVEFGEAIARELSSSIENAYLYAKMKQMAIHDALTGAYNRMYLMTYLNELFASQPATLSVLMFDLDHFKKVNDKFGHLAGDMVLRLSSKLVQKKLGEQGILARYGGEEFVIILPETGQTEAYLLAEQIRLAIADHQFLDESKARIPVTISVGLATFPAVASEYQKLLQLADGALYQAKNGGRNQVCIAQGGTATNN